MINFDDITGMEKRDRYTEEAVDEIPTIIHYDDISEEDKRGAYATAFEDKIAALRAKIQARGAALQTIIKIAEMGTQCTLCGQSQLGYPRHEDGCFALLARQTLGITQGAP